MLRRLLLDHDEFHGEVIFTFDGDEAGQKAALRAFGGDQQFVGQTYVAIEPEGRDPCELRIAEGDAAVRELIARRVPLYRFVLRNVISQFDLDRADSRVDAVREAVKLVVSIRDKSKVEAFAREVAGMIGVDIDDVRAEVRAGPGPSSRRHAHLPAGSARRRRRGPADVSSRRTRPDGAALLHRARRAQDRPAGPNRDRGQLGASRRVGLHASLLPRDLRRGEQARRPGRRSVDGLRETVTERHLQTLLSALSVEQLHVTGEPAERLGREYVVRLRELAAMRRISELKSRLQRMNPVTQTTEYNRLFGELVALESHRRSLRESALGDD